MPRAALTCLYCEFPIKPGEPVSSCGIAGDDGAVLPVVVPIHLACSIDTIAGEVADTVLDAIDHREVRVRLQARGRTMSEKLVNLAKSWIAANLEGD